jgi:broad specificity phosphatase PhoE
LANRVGYRARVTELVLVRHGETVGQSSIRLYGATDVALAPEGELQAAAAGRLLVGRRFDGVYSSPLHRARRSAEIVLDTLSAPQSDAKTLPHPPVSIELVEGFREIDFGRWEGWTWDEVEARDPENLARWSSEGPAFRFPEGEVRREFVARVQAAVAPSIESRFAAGAEQLLAVVHKGVIKAIAARLLDIPFTELEGLALPLGAVRRLRMHAGRWRLILDPEDDIHGNFAQHPDELVTEQKLKPS